MSEGSTWKTKTVNPDQILQEWTTIGEVGQSVVGDEDTLLQVQFLQVVTVARQRLKAIVSELITARHLKGDQRVAIVADWY